MIPNAIKSKPLSPEDVQFLVEKTGKSQAWCARMLGLSPNQLNNIANGKSKCSYVVQFALESLAYACDRLKQ